MKQFLILSIASLIALNACKCKEQCSGFDTRYLKLIPYNLSDNITYTIGNEDITFSVTTKEYTEPYKGECKFNLVQCNCAVACEPANKATMGAKTSLSKGSKKSIWVYLNMDGMSEKQQMHYYVFDFESGGTFIHELRSYSSQSASVLPELLANGKRYTNILVQYNDTLIDSNKAIWRVYLTNEQGIIGFSDRLTHSDYFLK